MTNEIWIPIKGHEESYSVSNTGKIKSHKRNKGGKILNGTVDTDGYIVYTFYGLGFYKKLHAQRIIALHFIANPENKPTVNHKDGDKFNNHVDNLEWATHQEQITHAVINGLRRYRVGPFTEEHKQKLSAAMIGRAPWNKGKKGVQVAWNKGLKLTKH